jgi:hypothetical protein
MPQARHQSKPLLPLLLAVGLAVAAAGCAGEAGKSVAEAAGMATTAAEPKPFVRETRPADPRYIPVGTTLPVNPLCEGDTPRPAFVPQGAAAHFTYRPDGRKPNEDCKPRAEFKKIEAELEAKRLANEAAGNQAKSLGSTPAPKPAAIPSN